MTGKKMQKKDIVYHLNQIKDMVKDIRDKRVDIVNYLDSNDIVSAKNRLNDIRSKEMEITSKCKLLVTLVEEM